MKLGQQLKIKQNQSLIMTPQLQQAIKLLQLSNIELAEFIDNAQLENPFLKEKTGLSEKKLESAENTTPDICNNLNNSTDPLKKDSNVDLENTFDTHLSSDFNRENKTFEVSDRKPLLQELRSQGVDLPYGCEYGGCITCAAKLINGEVDQRSQVALNNRQINNGYVVLCVARPKTDCEIEIGVESHDKLYRNPFLDPLAPHELKADIATQKNIKKNK